MKLSDLVSASGDVRCIHAPCELCMRVVAMGPIFHGRYVVAYDAIVCDACWAEDRNGWRTEHLGRAPLSE